MNRKIHINFFPRDSSRVRVISFSHGLGLAFVFTTIPLCLIGFWLALSGVLHEKPARKLERQRLERENHALKEKTVALLHETNGLEQNLDSLESTRLRAVSATGLEASETHQTETRSGVFPFFHLGSERSSSVKNLSGDLKRARQASLFFDSSLFVLSRNRYLASHLPTSYPIGSSALVIRHFGPGSDPFTGRKGLHGGVDFSLRVGAPIYAAGDGEVISEGQDPLWGNFIRIKHTDRLETFYAHLQQVKVQTGQEVSRGQMIGKLGQTGATTGPHLHFEILFKGEKVDPLQYLLPQDLKISQGSKP